MSLDLKAMSDRAELTDLVHRYALAVDSRDLDAVMACFTDDAAAHYDPDFECESPAAIRAFLTAAFRDGLGLTCPSTHLMTNTLINLAGDEASLQTTAVACLTRAGNKVVVRGLRYIDRAVRKPDGWRLSFRRHQADWAFETDALFVAALDVAKVQRPEA